MQKLIWDTQLNLTSADWTNPESGSQEQRSQNLLAKVNELQDINKRIHNQNILHAALYDARDLISFAWDNTISPEASLAYQARPADDIIKIAVSVYVSQLTRNIPGVEVLPVGGSFIQRRQAKQLNQWLWGKREEQNITRLVEDVVRQACIFGFGAIHVKLDKHDKICFEMVHADDLLIPNDHVAASGKVDFMYRRTAMPRSKVEQLYNIDLTDANLQSIRQYYLTLNEDWVILVEGWTVAVDGTPGRHMLAVGDKVLIDEPWEKEVVPFVFININRPIRGFYAMSLVEEAIPIQTKMNRLNRAIDRSQSLFGKMIIFDPNANSSRALNLSEFDNEIGKVFPVTPGNIPQFHLLQAVSPEIYNEREMTWKKGFDQLGINITSVGGLPPGARLDSSKALVEAAAQQTDRLIVQAREVERGIVEAFRLALSLLKEGTSDTVKVPTRLGAKRFVDVIDIGELHDALDSFTLQLKVTPEFSRTKENALAKLQEALSLQHITPAEYQLAVSTPDQLPANSLAVKALEYREWLLYRLELGDVPVIEPYSDLQNDYTAVMMNYLELITYEDLPDEVRQAHISWLSQAKSALDEAKAQLQREAAAAAMAQLPQGGMQADAVNVDPSRATG